MTHNPYSFNTKDYHRYTFASTGRTRIIKVVDFSPTTRKNLYNLGFGDLTPDGSIDDTVKSNNGDILKVLATVVQIARIFMIQFPNAEIFFIGSTDDRTRLYARILTMYYGEFHREFIINGLKQSGYGYTESPFDPHDAFDYFAFLIKKIE